MTNDTLTSVQDLCIKIENYKDDPSKLYERVIQPETAAVAEEVKALERYRRMVKPTDDELVAWYALSRLSDLMLVHCQALQHTDFFAQLGFEPTAPIEFTPFECEIAHAKNSDDEPGVRLTRVLSPALYFGDMMFCRARVEVVANPEVLEARTASGSTLYFTYIRDLRKTNDESHGWGESEQWSTFMRRDYKHDGKLYYNCDAEYMLPDDVENDEDGLLGEELSADLLTELVVYRSFVKPVDAETAAGADPYNYGVVLPVHHSLTLRA
jgi:hypothetical protein